MSKNEPVMKMRAHWLRRSLVLFLAPPLMACDGTGGPEALEELAAPDKAIAVPPQEHSGSRLKVEVLNAGDGAYKRLRLFDSELERECIFERTSDQGFTCVPPSTGFVLYLDEGCTEPAILLGPENASAWTAVLSGVDCEGIKSFQFFKPDETLNPRDQPLFSATESTCTPVDSVVLNDRVLTKMIPIERPNLQEGRLVLEAGEARLRQTFIEGDDGSRTFAGVMDVEEGVSCDLFDSSTESLCISKKFVPISQSWFSDSSCSENLIRIPSDCDKPSYGYQRFGSLASLGSGDEAPKTSPFFEIGDVYENETASFASGMSCESRPLSDAGRSTFYLRGKTVMEPDAPKSSPGVFGSGRILLMDAQNSDFNRLHSSFSSFFDAERDAACRTEALCDGTTVCITGEEVLPALHFSDPNCTIPLGNDGHQLTLMRRVCGEAAQLYDIQKQVHEGPVYTRTFNECVTTDWWSGNPPLHTTSVASEHSLPTVERRFLPR